MVNRICGDQPKEEKEHNCYLKIVSCGEQIKSNSVLFKKPTRPNKWKYRQPGKTTKSQNYYSTVMDYFSGCSLLLITGRVMQRLHVCLPGAAQRETALLINCAWKLLQVEFFPFPRFYGIKMTCEFGQCECMGGPKSTLCKHSYMYYYYYYFTSGIMQ